MSVFNGSHDSINLIRRKLITQSAAVVTTSALPLVIHANTNTISERSLTLLNLHTDELLETCYWANGQYQHKGLSEISYILRDHRTEKAHKMDPALLDLLHLLHEKCGSNAPFHVISGYRSPETNIKLRKNSDGVAKKSLHMQGKAIDIRLPDIALNKLHSTAVALQAGGVGYYAKSNFLHVDIGKPRTW